MKICLVFVVGACALVAGCCSDKNSAPGREWEAQVRQAQTQLDDAERQAKRTDEQQAKAEEEQRRMDKILDKWEEQARRLDAILDKTEKANGGNK